MTTTTTMNERTIKKTTLFYFQNPITVEKTLIIIKYTTIFWLKLNECVLCLLFQNWICLRASRRWMVVSTIRLPANIVPTANVVHWFSKWISLSIIHSPDWFELLPVMVGGSQMTYKREILLSSLHCIISLVRCHSYRHRHRPSPAATRS